jgi:hypothetical protein
MTFRGFDPKSLRLLESLPARLSNAVTKQLGHPRLGQLHDEPRALPKPDRRRWLALLKEGIAFAAA